MVLLQYVTRTHQIFVWVCLVVQHLIALSLVYGGWILLGRIGRKIIKRECVYFVSSP